MTPLNFTFAGEPRSSLAWGRMFYPKSSIGVSPALSRTPTGVRARMGRGFQFIILKDETCSRFCPIRETKRPRQAVPLIALLFDNLFGNIWACSCKLPS